MSNLTIVSWCKDDTCDPCKPIETGGVVQIFIIANVYVNAISNITGVEIGQKILSAGPLGSDYTGQSWYDGVPSVVAGWAVAEVCSSAQYGYYSGFYADPSVDLPGFYQFVSGPCVQGNPPTDAQALFLLNQIYQQCLAAIPSIPLPPGFRLP